VSTYNPNKQKKPIDKSIYCLNELNFYLFVFFLLCLVAGVVTVFTYDGDDKKLIFLISWTFSSMGNSSRQNINGIFAIFCFCFILLFFLCVLSEIVLVCVSKKMKFNTNQWIVSSIYIVLIVVTFSLVTSGLFVHVGDSYLIDVFEDKSFDWGFYHFYGEDDAKQTLSLLGYFSVIFSCSVFATYFIYKMVFGITKKGIYNISPRNNLD